MLPSMKYILQCWWNKIPFFTVQCAVTQSRVFYGESGIYKYRKQGHGISLPRASNVEEERPL